MPHNTLWRCDDPTQAGATCRIVADLYDADAATAYRDLLSVVAALLPAAERPLWILRTAAPFWVGIAQYVVECPWEDGPSPEDAAIDATHPLKTGRHHLYAEAMRLVGTRHSKGELVALVNYLLYRLEAHF